MTDSTLIPATHLDLLERPLFAHLATLRADGSPQVNPMWQAWDGERLAMTTSTRRAKYRQIKADPRVAVAIHDPDQPYRYIELRGVVAGITPDPEGDFFFELAARYGSPIKRGQLADAPFRVKVEIVPTSASHQ